jgi:hypothetical protein
MDVRHAGTTCRVFVHIVPAGSTGNTLASSRRQTPGRQYDGPGYAVRGCATAPKLTTICTAWH